MFIAYGNWLIASAFAGFAVDVMHFVRGKSQTLSC